MVPVKKATMKMAIVNMATGKNGNGNNNNNYKQVQ